MRANMIIEKECYR